MSEGEPWKAKEMGKEMLTLLCFGPSACFEQVSSCLCHHRYSLHVPGFDRTLDLQSLRVISSLSSRRVVHSRWKVCVMNVVVIAGERLLCLG